VRFDAAASLASKAFSSEEVQQVLQYSPGSHYQLLTEVSTTAMYGDTFTVISRYNLVGKGPGRTHLHVAYAIEFKPSLSRLMKPMVAKGVDGEREEWRAGGAVRGTGGSRGFLHACLSRVCEAQL
jgi:hypothetical protein